MRDPGELRSACGERGAGAYLIVILILLVRIMEDKALTDRVSRNTAR